VIIFIYILFGIAIFSLYRLVIGPTIQNRLVALSSISVIFIVILAIYSIQYRNMFFLDVSIAFFLLDFIGIIAFTKYLGKEEIK
jgi:multisubunit Na+/H+ antiporter MnhF subunit